MQKRVYQENREKNSRNTESLEKQRVRKGLKYLKKKEKSQIKSAIHMNVRTWSANSGRTDPCTPKRGSHVFEYYSVVLIFHITDPDVTSAKLKQLYERHCKLYDRV